MGWFFYLLLLGRKITIQMHGFIFPPNYIYSNPQSLKVHILKLSFDFLGSCCEEVPRPRYLWSIT